LIIPKMIFMIRFLFLLFPLLIIQFTTLGQCNDRYKTRHFNSIQVFRDVVYSKDAPALLAASLTTETTYNKDLVMDVFMPPLTDTVSDRPVVVIGHGGGFINVAFMGGTLLVGTKDNDDVQALADTLAHWGYVTAVIEYRLGFNVLSTSSIKRAMWRGAQDMSAAVRFFRKNSYWFGIDHNRVFSAGSSAGAFCALHSTFVDYTERMAESYELVPLLKRDLGAMHSRPVVELSGFNPFSGTSVLGDDVDSIPQGIAAYWGAIAGLSRINASGNHAPAIMFHGTGDLVVDNKCNKPFSSVILVAPVTCGTYMMDSVLSADSVLHEAYYAQGENHEYWGVVNGNWTLSGPNAYWPDIIQKTADFFYKIMKPDLPAVSGPSNVLPATNYTYSVLNPQSGHTYCWEINGGLVVSPYTNAASVDVQFYNITSQGDVTVSAIDPAGFYSDKTTHVVTVSFNNAIEKISTSLNKLFIQPNPAKENCSLSFNCSEYGKGRIRVYNVVGNLVIDFSSVFKSGNNVFELPVKTLKAGLYFVQISKDKSKITERLIIR
jgi:acetyl esterase/lipase